MVGWLFALHCSLIVRGKTMYETFKWLDYKDHCIDMAQESRYGAKGALACDQSRAVANSPHCLMQLASLHACCGSLSCFDLQTRCSSQVLAVMVAVA